jgi:hypothetical protein
MSAVVLLNTELSDCHQNDQRVHCQPKKKRHNLLKSLGLFHCSN